MTGRPQAKAAGHQRRITLLSMLTVLAAAFVLRGRYFGIPDISIDEQFYLLVGDRILHQGALPYVDIWDRKPPGLFLIYAAIRLLGGHGIIEYQVVATLFAAATAMLIAWWVRHIAGNFAAVAAGLFYLVLPHRLGGAGGQAEIFVNLFLVAAAWLIARRLHPIGAIDQRSLRATGTFAMLLSGLAMQIKPTAAIPGMFLGLFLIHQGYRSGWSHRRVVAAALLWVASAMLPSVVAMACYAANGHLDAYFFANFQSLALKSADPLPVTLDRFRSAMLRVGLPIAGALAATGWACWRGTPNRCPTPMLLFILGWLAAGFVAFVSVGVFYSYYAVILLPMACVLIGTVAGPRGIGWIVLVGMGLFGAQILRLEQPELARQRAAAASVYRMADTISANLNGGCMYIHRGPPILYLLTDSCLATRFAFPNHLGLSYEQDAVGVDTAAEVRRILATRPSVIVFHEVSGNDNEAATALVRKAIAESYHPIASGGPAGPGRYRAFGLNVSSPRPIPG